MLKKPQKIHIKDCNLIATSRYGQKDLIHEFRDMAYLNFSWWEKSKNRWDGWNSPDEVWIPILEKFNLIQKITETITTYEKLQ
jgi:hypothetical protein